MTTQAAPALPNEKGLGGAEASVLLEHEGYNELPQPRGRRSIRLFVELLREPMVFLLLCCGGIYFWLGDRQEALSLLGFLGIILGITWYQENKTERALAALRDLSSPRALVLRDGVKVRIPGREVVRGDVVFLSEGDRVPADGQIISSSHLDVDESMLTGESQPVAKVLVGAPVFSGTTVVKGSGIARVTATGQNTELGKIGKMLHPTPAPPSRLEQETRHLVKIIAFVALGLCALVVAAYGLYGHPRVDGLLAGLTLAMAILPNELPAVLTIFLALGAWRLSRRRVLTRRIAAVEALGTATVLCVDKTGTLTYNRMAVRALATSETLYDLTLHSEKPLPDAFHEVLEYGLLAAAPNAFDPMDIAVQTASTHLLAATEHLHPDWTLTHEYPLSPTLLAVSQVWRPQNGGQFTIGAKGAPEAIVDLCHMASPAREAVARQVKAMAAQGLRVLGVAKGKRSDGPMPENPHDLTFSFVGLVGLEDPLRAEVPEAVSECRRAGMRVIMITGDHAETALSIARQAGLDRPELVLTGTEIARLSPAELAERLGRVSVCARVVPEQKARLVDALKSRGEIVAMTGDGVNDAPALKRADIGIAMGQRGTDVAREAASLVLLDDDFASIVGAVRMGRRTYDNLEHAMSYLLAVHIPIAGLSVIPALFNLPLILMPVHIAFLHLIIEPACSVAFEAQPEAADIMRRPPRPLGQHLYSRGVILPTMVQGLSVLGILTVVFFVAWRWGEGAANARSLAFTSLVFANLGLITASLWSKSESGQGSNRALVWTIVGTLSLLILVLYVPDLRSLFRFTYLHFQDLLLCFFAGIGSSLWFLLVRWSRTRWSQLQLKEKPWTRSAASLP